jgi:uncharacterized protein (TIGR02246 family)
MYRINRIFTMLLLAALLLSACQPIQPSAQLPQRQPTAEAVMQAFVTAWSEGKVEALDAIAAPNFVVHDPPGPDIQGLDAYKANILQARIGVPDAKLTFVEGTIVGDKLYTRWTYGGTHTGNDTNLGPPTGRSFLMTGNTIVRFDKGRLVEMWHSADDLGMMLQDGMQLLPAAATTAAPAAVDIRSTIAAANDQFMATFARGDAAGMAAFYTSDGQLLPNNSDFVSGQPAIQDFWQSLFAAGMKGVKLEIVEAKVMGDTAYEVSKFTLYTANNQVADQGKYIIIWQQVDGQWKIHRDIFNSSLPSK